ncbi:MAG: hypothetical protein AAF394_02925, partial [Planctomycetota bacterium]
DFAFCASLSFRQIRIPILFANVRIRTQPDNAGSKVVTARNWQSGSCAKEFWRIPLLFYCRIVRRDSFRGTANRCTKWTSLAAVD